MTPYNLIFDPQVKELEELHQWDVAAKLVYQQWKKKPMDLNALLCAGTQAWLGLLDIDYDCLEPDSKYDRDMFDVDSLYDILTEVSRWGHAHFSENAVFNAYFGYMMQAMPYLFEDMKGDWDGWRKKGIEMMRYSYQLEPDNLFAKAMFYEPTYRNVGDSFYNACMEIWNDFTPEQWGDSSVQQYFFYILAGAWRYPDAYHS